ncbi:uncharacterized protein LOC119555199 [Drosophila subpulchrella]|uniref:uncharacterized protein LOC119555199 n=1 Tax=Drosophila subpulchrella TaxID=1486046 RepID=UPI0018A1940A|nr:uncharacterized protein LOC119555199 [Drosophila subpulchrella]
MQSNKVLFLFFGVLAIVIAVSLSSEVVDQGNDAISDRRFRWEFSEDSDEPANDSQADDGRVDESDIIISESIEYQPASSKSNESGSTEA